MARILIVMGAIAAFWVSSALADDSKLSETQARNFVSSLEPIDAFAKDLEAQGKIDQINLDARPKANEEFKPYSKAIANLKKDYPGDFARLGAIVKKFNFTPAQWGLVGDRVMIAYFALVMEEEDPRTFEMMEGFDKSMLEMMPPEMRPQLESTFAMMDAARKAPDSDKNVVALVKPELDAALEKMEAGK